MSNGYNGHKSWAHWNVSLWINNDEGLYRQACYLCRQHNRSEAAQLMLESFHSLGITHTPDGARYTATTIRAAMEGM